MGLVGLVGWKGPIWSEVIRVHPLALLPVGPEWHSGAVDTGQFWKLIADARAQVADPADSEAVAARVTSLLRHLPREEIVAAQRVLSDLMAASYRNSLWAAASLINGGCGDDGFDYFRGWLIAQGREVFEQSVADPEALANLPVIDPAGPRARWLECEEMLYIARRAQQAATGETLPAEPVKSCSPELDAGWEFDFDDRAMMERRLPRLTALCWPDVTNGGTGAP